MEEYEAIDRALQAYIRGVENNPNLSEEEKNELICEAERDANREINGY